MMRGDLDRIGESGVKVFGLAGVLAFGLAAPGWAEGLELPSIPDRPESELFKDAPAPWRDYLLKARVAERIVDPLQRCLAYPDLPGNQWPAGHTEAHCRDHQIQPMPLAGIEQLLKAGQAGELEALARRLLAMHPQSEDIHVFMDQFRAESDAADRISAAWLAAAPDSAFALNARAAYLASQARRARGGAFAAETPRENLRQMHALYLQAVPLYQRAAAIEPGLITAYEGLLEAGYRDSEPAWERAGAEGGEKVDPGCPMLAGVRMDALQPRWGGSYEAMLAFAAQLEPLVAKRPLLAVRTGAAYADRADRLLANQEYTAEARDLLDIAIRKGSLEDPMQDAAKLYWFAEDARLQDRWKSLAYNLQAARFSERNEWTHRMIAWGLLQDAPDVSVRHVEIALKQEPASAVLHYIAGAAYNNVGKPAQAQPHYLKAADDQTDTQHRQASLRELVSMWMFHAGLSPKDGSTRAKPYLDRLIREYPEDGRARMYRIQSEGAINRVVQDGLIKDFEQRMDPEDPMQAAFKRQLDEARKHPTFRDAPAKAVK